MNLAEEQEKIVNTSEKYSFILAGAGSGKTRVITERINKLLETNENYKILAITFTVKASKELKERVNNKNIQASTFHSFCYKELIKKERNIKIEEDLPFSEKELLQVSLYKNSLFANKKPSIYGKYEDFLKSRNLMDYDDLLLNFLNKNEKEYEFDYIFIDEFQDTNELQYKVLKSIISSKTILMAVGDPNQSIYSFRGANPKIINRYIKDFKAKIFTLLNNYRSTKKIITASNNLIAHNNQRFKFNMVSQNSEIGDVRVYEISDEIDENKILNLIIEKDKEKSIGILFRNNYQSRKYAKKFKDLKNVFVLTIHQSKGLEFDTVIILGVTKENHFNKIETSLDIEEERRIFYVAVTRAKENLYIFTDTKLIKFLFVRETRILKYFNFFN
ncbi:MAG: UvrD-helicase domain-containing protein [Acholeplasmatales bacterium]|jgi:DNA helicase-2/ATP-dependent DNA helicase PcrA|nr:UvrD-helicase domain-containing protein [Acholeplasmatales bacterium]